MTDDTDYQCPRCGRAPDAYRQLALVRIAPDARLVGICISCLTEAELLRTDPSADLRDSHPTHVRREGAA